MSAIAEQRWVVMPFWRLQALHRRFKLRRLADPMATLGATDNATVLVLKASKALIDEAALADLAKLYLGNPLMEVLDERVRRRKSSGYTGVAVHHAP